MARQPVIAASVEGLEGRRLLSSATLHDGVLLVVGGPRREVIQMNINADAGVVVVGFVGEAARSFPVEDVDLVVVRAGGGDDWVLIDDGNPDEGDVAFNIPLVVDGGAGDDLLTRAPRATTPAVFYGGAGDDTVRGGAGVDLIFGGGGNDVLSGGADDDLLVGGPGDDELLD